jgi:hypothetical protein
MEILKYLLLGACYRTKTLFSELRILLQEAKIIFHRGGRKPLGRPMRRQVDNIRMDLG